MGAILIWIAISLVIAFNMHWCMSRRTRQSSRGPWSKRAVVHVRFRRLPSLVFHACESDSNPGRWTKYLAVLRVAAKLGKMGRVATGTGLAEKSWPDCHPLYRFWWGCEPNGWRNIHSFMSITSPSSWKTRPSAIPEQLGGWCRQVPQFCAPALMFFFYRLCYSSLSPMCYIFAVRNMSLRRAFCGSKFIRYIDVTSGNTETVRR